MIYLQWLHIANEKSPVQVSAMQRRTDSSTGYLTGNRQAIRNTSRITDHSINSPSSPSTEVPFWLQCIDSQCNSHGTCQSKCFQHWAQTVACYCRIHITNSNGAFNFYLTDADTIMIIQHNKIRCKNPDIVNGSQIDTMFINTNTDLCSCCIHALHHCYSKLTNHWKRHRFSTSDY